MEVFIMKVYILMEEEMTTHCEDYGNLQEFDRKVYGVFSSSEEAWNAALKFYENKKKEILEDDTFSLLSETVIKNPVTVAWSLDCGMYSTQSEMRVKIAEIGQLYNEPL
jgi:hypothetical protein